MKLGTAWAAGQWYLWAACTAWASELFSSMPHLLVLLLPSCTQARKLLLLVIGWLVFKQAQIRDSQLPHSSLSRGGAIWGNEVNILCAGACFSESLHLSWPSCGDQASDQP